MSPALKVLLPFIPGILVAAEFFIPTPVLLAAAAALFVLLVWTFTRNHHRLFFLIAFVLVFCLAALRTNLVWRHTTDQDVRFFVAKAPVAVEGVIKSPVIRYQDRRAFELEADSCWVESTPHPARGRILVNHYDTTSTVQYGDRVLIKGVLRRPPGSRNPGDFDYRLYLAGRRIFTLMNVSDSPVYLLAHAEGNVLMQYFVVPLREWCWSVLHRHLSQGSAALIYGLLIGDQSEIKDDVQQSFRDTGVIHVLAVSGMHVGFVVVALIFFFRSIRVTEPWRTVLVILSVFFYATLTGNHSPVFRAAIMAALILAAPLLQRRIDPLNILSLAALVILLNNPLQLFMTGFQLSFMACLGMLLLYQRFRALAASWYEKSWLQHRPARYLLDLFLISLAAQLATLPLLLYYFYNLPIIAVFANLVVIPLTGVVMGLGFLLVALAWLPAWLVGPLAGGIDALVRFWVAWIHFFAQLPGSHWSVPRPSWIVIWIMMFLLGLFVYWQNERAAKRILVICILLVNLYVWQHALQDPWRLRVTFFDVGQGDACLFEFPDGQVLLVDGGDRTGKIDYGERVIVPYLLRNGIYYIENILITHPHADHLGGIPYIMEHIRVGRILTSPFSFEDSLSQQIRSLAQSRQVALSCIKRGDIVNEYPHTCLYVLHPDTGQVVVDAGQSNDLSVVVKLVFGRCSFLLTGDAGCDPESQWLQRWDDSMLASDVIKVAHHGSATASSKEFCDHAAATFAVVSVGRQNRFALPSQEVIERWQEQGATVCRTDEEGAVVFTSNGYDLARTY